MRSTYDWSSQGGKLPRCVLPRTGDATAVSRARRQALVQMAELGQSGQGTSRKAAQTSSVAERLTAVQPPPQGSRGTVPQGDAEGAPARSERGGRANALPRRRPSQARNAVLLPSVPGTTGTVKSWGAGRDVVIVALPTSRGGIRTNPRRSRLSPPIKGLGTRTEIKPCAFVLDRQGEGVLLGLT